MREFVVHQYSLNTKLPQSLRKFFVEPVFGGNGIFLVDGTEVLVYNYDYLIFNGKRLYHYPRNIWELRERKV